VSGEVERFYNEFAPRLVGDLVKGNPRVKKQFELLRDAVPPGVAQILVIGFGSGQVAHYLAGLTTSARIRGVDVSSENVRIAKALFEQPRVTFEQLDVTRQALEGSYDLIILPDVYEHIPLAARAALHKELTRSLAPNGRLILTLPSPGHQKALREQGHGLQAVDETVTLNDLVCLARDVGGELTYFNSISVWRTNDYLHAVIERGAESERPLALTDRLPLKGWPKSRLLSRAWGSFERKSGLLGLKRAWLRRSYARRLGRKGQSV
jgi:SAM-dependent methyltransferase